MNVKLLLMILLLGTFVPAAAQASWQEEWERTLAAAKQEGRVAVTGPGGPEARGTLTRPFTKKYGITVEFMGGSGRTTSPRVLTERRAHRYLWDVYVSGTTTGLTTMLPAGAFDPLEPALILPEVKDPNRWRGGGLEFVDEGRQLMVMTPSYRGIIFVNTKMVNPEEFTSYKSLLDPKWKGKIVIDDPRKPGPGNATFLFFYLHPELGMDFIRAFARQRPIILKNYRQEVDLVAQGKYPILLGGWELPVEVLMKKGLPITIIKPAQLREGSDVSPSNGAVALYNKAPHPNAAKVYVNWLLSKSGQTLFSRAMGYISARQDVSTKHSPWRVPKPGSIKTYTLEAMAVKRELVPKLQKVFGR